MEVLPMAAISKELADQIIANGGYYADDPRVVRVVEYDNAFGGKEYGIEYPFELGRYEASHYVRNPKVIWEAK
jgi:hypothetical protein